MHKVSIDDIENDKNKTYHVDFNDKIPEIDADINASIDLVSLGEFIEVKGKVKGIVKLECDLCLDNYNYKLDFDIDEMYAKNTLFDEPKQETELKTGQFITDLNGENEIDIYDLLYQSVILQLPNKKVCGINCKGDNFAKDEGEFVQDERMAVFKNIKIENK